MICRSTGLEGKIPEIRPKIEPTLNPMGASVIMFCHQKWTPSDIGNWKKDIEFFFLMVIEGMWRDIENKKKRSISIVNEIKGYKSRIQLLPVSCCNKQLCREGQQVQIGGQSLNRMSLKLCAESNVSRKLLLLHNYWNMCTAAFCVNKTCYSAQ